jgi:hypothetical protein
MASAEETQNHKERHSSFWRWLGFSVIIGLVPIIASLILAALIKKPTSLLEIIAHGELFIISIALVAEALRDLQYINKEKSDGFKSFIQWGAIIVLICSCLFFGVVATHDESVSSSIATLSDIIKEGNNTIDTNKLVAAAKTIKANEGGLDTGLIDWLSIGTFTIALITGGNCKWSEKSSNSSSDKPTLDKPSTIGSNKSDTHPENT